MTAAYYIQVFENPEQLKLVVKHLNDAYPDWRASFSEVVIVDCSAEARHIKNYANLCAEYGFRHLSTGVNHGISGGRVIAARDFVAAPHDLIVTHGDGMLWQPNDSDLCRYGFARHVPGFFSKILEIATSQGLDYFKLTWCEKHGTNEHYYAYHALRPDEKTQHFPWVYSGMTPTTEVKSISAHRGVPYAVGNFPYSNWPALWSKRFARCFIGRDAKEAPSEESWMRQLFRDSQNTRNRDWRVACALLTPVAYNHVHDYKRSKRREN